MDEYGIEIACEGRGTRRIKAQVTVPLAVPQVWAAMTTMYAHIVSHLSWIAVNAVRRVEDGLSLDLVVRISRTFRLSFGVTAEIRFDHEEKRMHVHAERLGFVYDGTFDLRSVDGETELRYDATVAGITACGLPLPLPFWEVKIATGTQHMMRIVHNAGRFKGRYATFVEEMERLVPDIERRLVTSDMPGSLKEHIRNLVEYNAKGGKMHRAFMADLLFHRLVDVTDTQRRQIRTIGWSFELLQAFALVHDDVMDRSETRRGKPCWYKVVGVPHAINDGCLLHIASHILINSCGLDSDVQARFHDELDFVSYSTCLGQHLDMSLETRPPETFTDTEYFDTVRLKTAYYTFYLPLAAAIILARGPDEFLRDGA